MLDSGANTTVINGRDAKHAKVRYPLNPPLEIRGINGLATATEGCILQVGELEIQGPIIEGAARSVVNPRSLMHTGGNFFMTETAVYCVKMVSTHTLYLMVNSSACHVLMIHGHSTWRESE